MRLLLAQAWHRRQFRRLHSGRLSAASVSPRCKRAPSMRCRWAPRDFAQLKQPKGHMLGDTEKEIRFAYVGLAVSSRLLARQPNLVETFLRSVIKGREYARRYREQTIPIIGKHTQRKREFNEFDYDSTLRF